VLEWKGHGLGVLMSLCLTPLLLLLACASSQDREDQNEQIPQTGSVNELLALLDAGVDIDYTPLSSPEDAIQKSDLIVRGRVVDVMDGIGFEYSDSEESERQQARYATFVVEVEEVLARNASEVLDDRVYVQVPRSPATSIEQLSAANSRADAIFILDDITKWQPTPDAIVVPPSGIPSEAPLLTPYTDGGWLQGPKDAAMMGIGIEPAELGSGWEQVDTLDELASVIAEAAQT